MKKNLKTIVIYGIILLLCAAAAVDFIRNKTAAGADAAGILTASGTLEHAEAIIKKSAEPPAPNPTVGIGRGTDYASVTRSAIENAGGLKDIIKKGDVVLIKPNLCTNAKPDSPTTTDYRVVKEVAAMAKECGASKIIIAEGSFVGETFNEINFRQNLYDTIKDVEFFNINNCEKEDCYELTPENNLLDKTMFIPKVYMDADVVITVPKMKTHYVKEAVVSLSLKNCFGAISTRVYGSVDKSGLHSFNLNEVISEINKIRRPDFAVIDGIVGGEGYGPVSNTPVESNIVIAGKDLVAVDTVGLTFMGQDVDHVPHVKFAGEQNIGISDINKIKIVGAKLDEIKMYFKR